MSSPHPSADGQGTFARARLRERQDEMLGAVDVGLWYCDLPFSELAWDAKVKEHFWLPPDARVTIDDFYARLHPDDRERTRRAIDASIAAQSPYDIEYRTVAPPEHPQAGTVRWVRAIGYTAYDSAGQPIRFDGITVDISAAKKAASALAEAEAALKHAARDEAQLVSTLQRIGVTLAAELELDPIVQTVTDEATQLTGAQFGAFFYNLIDAKGESYTLYTLSGVPREAFSRFPMPRNTHVFAPTFNGEGVVRSDDITKDPRYGKNEPYFGMPKGHLPVVSYLAVPVRSHSGEVIGGLFFGHEAPGVFTERHEQLVNGIAGWASLAMDNARLFDTQRRAIEDAERTRGRLQDVIEQAPAAITISEGPNHVMVTRNAISRRMVGGRTTIGQALLESFPAAREQGFLALLDRVYQTGEPFVGTEMPVRYDFDNDGVPEERFFNIVYQPLRDADQQVHGILTHSVDVSEQVRARREIERKAVELAQLTEALERSNRDLDQFAYVASHDLKAPLRGIANLAQWIEEDLGDKLDGESRSHMQLLKGRVHRMDALIDGILAYSRAGRGRGSPERIDTGALVREVIELMAPPSSVRFEVASDLPVIVTERVPLQQIFLNLLGNAVKYTIAERPDPFIEIGWRDQGPMVEFHVRDNGPGIPPEFHDRIWGIFQTLQPRDKVEGTGIGLAVVKKSVEARGGAVWVESSPGAGTTFRFTIAKLASQRVDDA